MKKKFIILTSMVLFSAIPHTYADTRYAQIMSDGIKLGTKVFNEASKVYSDVKDAATSPEVTAQVDSLKRAIADSELYQDGKEFVQQASDSVKVLCTEKVDSAKKEIKNENKQ